MLMTRNSIDAPLMSGVIIGELGSFVAGAAVAMISSALTVSSFAILGLETDPDWWREGLETGLINLPSTVEYADEVCAWGGDVAVIWTSNTCRT
jgi:hypothetical protein